MGNNGANGWTPVFTTCVTSPFPKQSYPSLPPLPALHPTLCLITHLLTRAWHLTLLPSLKPEAPQIHLNWLNAEQGSGEALVLWGKLGKAPELSCLLQITNPALSLFPATDVVG